MDADQNLVARSARRLYARCQNGVLSTLSVELRGAPFGSVATFACDRRGWPLILVSSIAEHTRNLQADARVSLIVSEAGDDAQASGRLTLVGHAAPVPQVEADDSAQRYYRRFPQARHYHRAHDFLLYRIEPLRVRYIAGFGQIHWLEPQQLCLVNPFPPAIEERMIEHMNRDHVDAMRCFCRLLDVEANAPEPRLAAVDREGFDLMLGARLLRVDFERPVASADDVRSAMVALTLRARELGLQPA